jgi:sugar phosphate isomerase/epimerase
MGARYSLAHLTVLGCPPPEAIEIAARCGYDAVGLRTMPLGLAGEPRYVLEADRTLFESARRALRDTGVALLDVEDAVIREGHDVGDYRPALEKAAELGARHVLCNAWSGAPAFIQDQFDALCDLAAPLGLTVECEFVTFTEIVGLKDAWEIVRRSGRANAGVLIDTLHFARSGVALEEIETVPDDRLHYLQLCDVAEASAPSVEAMKHTARAERLYVGEGAAPIREVVERLPGRPLALEIIHAERVAALGYEAFAAECLRRAKAHLGDG